MFSCESDQVQSFLNKHSTQGLKIELQNQKGLFLLTSDVGTFFVKGQTGPGAFARTAFLPDIFTLGYKIVVLKSPYPEPVSLPQGQSRYRRPDIAQDAIPVFMFSCTPDSGTDVWATTWPPETQNSIHLTESLAHCG